MNVFQESPEGVVATLVTVAVLVVAAASALAWLVEFALRLRTYFFVRRPR
jgi:hypothetical protein